VNEQRLGKLRLFPRGLFFNLGFLPRTWQDPTYEHPALKDADGVPFTRGDNNPLAAVEVGGRAVPRGALRTVKVLGCLPILDNVR
jgi:inorganic pyrophosphatase